MDTTQAALASAYDTVTTAFTAFTGSGGGVGDSSGGVPYKSLGLTFMLAIYVWEQLLALRQLRNLRDPNLGVPPPLKDKVSAADHAKSRAYGADRARLALAQDAAGTAQSVAIIVADVLPWL
ncbi:hypothetical protein HK405_009922, partial [Cladochytrium tenue]